MRDARKTGHSSPLGATPAHGGVNFSLYSRNATGVELLLFDRQDDNRPARVIRLDPYKNRTYYYWHVFVPELHAGQIYAYRVAGPFDPGNALRFDPSKVLLDPYGRSVTVPKNYSRDAAGAPGDNIACAMKNMVVDPHAYNWEHDLPLCRPSSRTIIYEMHVAGFTRIPIPASQKRNAAPMPASSKKFPIFGSWALLRSSCFPFFSSTIRTAREGW